VYHDAAWNKIVPRYEEWAKGCFFMRYLAAGVQFEPRFGEKAWNLDRLTALIAQAAEAGARLIVLPEMATTGYCFQNRSEIAPMVEPIPSGPTVQHFARLAAQLNVSVIVGLPEVAPDTGAYYNAAALIGPHGYIGHYRKIHAYMTDTRWARDGDLGIPVFDTELGRIGVQICMDGDYFEPFRVAALSDADVIAFPTNWIGGRLPWRARAVETGCYMICADRWGEERGTTFAGHTTLLDPFGTEVDVLPTGDGLVMGEVDLEVARNARQRALAIRRPDHYQGLLLSSYLWDWRQTQGLGRGAPTVVAVAQSAEPGRVADQVRWADRQSRDHGWPKLDLAVLPCYVGGLDPETVRSLASSLDAHIVWGEQNRDGYTTAYLMGPEGMVGRYRQVHPEGGALPSDEGFPVFDLPWGRLGLLVGHELRIPEAVRLLAMQGADLIAIPGFQAEPLDHWIVKVRAMENETAIVTANSAGGSRLVYGGAPRQQASAGDVLVGRVDTNDEGRRTKELLRKRQPQWYDPLVRRPIE
jgi:predicted amidohydrolase